MSSCLSENNIAAVIGGVALNDAQLAHVATCEQCSAWVVCSLPTQSGDDGALAPGESIGRYELRRLVGRGAFGEVYQARDIALDRDVALKILNSDRDWTEQILQAFSKEAQALAKLRHPSVVSVFDVGSHLVGERTFPYFVMEYVKGGTLSSHLPQPSMALRLRWVAQLADAVAAVHRAGLIHRDIKPKNILIEDSAQLLLTDFGLSEYQSGVGRGRIGTPAYMAPEVENGAAATTLSDQYSFAMVASEILDGKRPENPTAAVLDGVPKHVAVAIRKAGSLNPTLRFASMQQLCEALRPRSVKKWIAIASAVTVSTSAIAATLILRSSTASPDFCDREAGKLTRPTLNCNAQLGDGRKHCNALDQDLAAFATQWNRESQRACQDRRPEVVFCFQQAKGTVLGIAASVAQPTFSFDATDPSDTPLPDVAICQKAPNSLPSPPRPEQVADVLRLQTELELSNPAATNSPSASISSQTKALDEAKLLGYAPLVARAHFHLASSLSLRRETHEQAWNHFQEAQRAADQGNDRVFAMDIACRIALFESNRGRTQSAQAYFGDAVAKARHLGFASSSLVLAKAFFDPTSAMDSIYATAIDKMKPDNQALVRIARLRSYIGSDALSLLLPEAAQLAVKCPTLNPKTQYLCESTLAEAYTRPGYARLAGMHAKAALASKATLQWAASGPLLRAASYAAVRTEDAATLANLQRAECSRGEQACQQWNYSLANFRNDGKAVLALLPPFSSETTPTEQLASYRQAALAACKWPLLGQVIAANERAPRSNDGDEYLFLYAKAMWQRSKGVNAEALETMTAAIQWREQKLPGSVGVEDDEFDAAVAAQLASKLGQDERAKALLDQNESKFAIVPTVMANIIVARVATKQIEQKSAQAAFALQVAAVTKQDPLTAAMLEQQWQRATTTAACGSACER